MRECIAPTGERTEALGRFKGSLRRSMNQFVAPLIRPARFRDLAFIGATPALSEPRMKDGTRGAGPLADRKEE